MIILAFDLFIADYFHYRIIFFLCSKDSLSEAWLTNLLPVQAAISSIGIAIMALLSGLNKESFFGISFTEYITSLKPSILKHRYLIVFNIMLVIANFYCISVCFYNLAIYIFIINVLIISWLVWNIFLVFSNKFKIQEEIKQFILKNCHDSHFKDVENTLTYFQKEITEAKITGNIQLMIQDLKFLEDLHSRMFDIEMDKKDFEFCHELYSSVCFNVLALKRSDTSKLVIESITKIYDTDNERYEHSNFPIHILENLSVENVFESLNCMELSERFHLYWNLKQALLKDTSHLKEIPHSRSQKLKDFSCFFYFYALRKNNDDVETFKSVVNNVFELGFLYLSGNKYWNDDFFNDDTKLLSSSDLTNFAITLINFKENVFNDIWKDYISRYTDFSRITEKFELQYIFSIQSYLYYISLRESLVDDSLRIYAKNLLRLSKNSWMTYVRTIWNFNLITSELVESVKNQVERWEKMEKDGNKFFKTVITPKVVEDFFFFCILSSVRDIESAVILLNGGNIANIWIKYGIDFENLKRNFSDWQKFLLPEWQQMNEEEINKKLRDVQNKLRRIYMKFLENEISKDVFDCSDLQKGIQAELNDLMPYFNVCYYNNNIKKETVSSKIFNCDRVYLEKHQLDDSIRDYIFSLVGKNYFSILKEYLQPIKFNKYDDDVVENVLGMLSKFSTGDIIVGFPNNFLVSNEKNQEYKSYLAKYTKKIRLPNGNQYIAILDSSKMIIRVSDLSIEVCDLTTDEINKDFKANHESWSYQFFGIDVTLDNEEKDSMIKFIKKRYCKLKITMTIEYRFEDNAGSIAYFVDEQH